MKSVIYGKGDAGCYTDAVFRKTKMKRRRYG